jgi:hypothetical protein
VHNRVTLAEISLLFGDVFSIEHVTEIVGTARAWTQDDNVATCVGFAFKKIRDALPDIFFSFTRSCEKNISTLKAQCCFRYFRSDESPHFPSKALISLS